MKLYARRALSTKGIRGGQRETPQTHPFVRRSASTVRPSSSPLRPMWSSGRSAARRALVAFGRRRVHVLADDARPGVFGLEGLHAPDDFSRLASAAVRRSEDIRASLASGAVTGVSVVDHLDEISDAVCSVVDVAELCRNVHPDPAWVDAANRAYVSLQGYVQGLNADRGLYDALVRAQSDASASGSFTPEAARVALTLRHDFERGGIHLDDDARARLERASADALRAAMRFQSNLADPAALGVARVPRSRLAGLPTTILGRLTGDATTATVPLDQHTLAACLRWVEDEDARRDVYAAAHAGPEANVDALRRLLTARAGWLSAWGSNRTRTTPSRRSSRDTRTPRAGCCARWRSEREGVVAKARPRQDSSRDARGTRRWTVADPRDSPRFRRRSFPSLESSRAAPRVGSRVRDGSRSDGGVRRGRLRVARFSLSSQPFAASARSSRASSV